MGVGGRRSNWMFMANAVRGSGKEVGAGDGASTTVSATVGKGNSTILEVSVMSRRQLRANEIVAGIGGEPNNLPLHSKYAAVMA